MNGRAHPDVQDLVDFVPEPNVLFEMGGWQDETHDAWHAEFVLINEELDPAARDWFQDAWTTLLVYATLEREWLEA